MLVSKKKRRLEQFEVEKRKYEERKLKLEKLIQDRTATILRLKASKTSIENNIASLDTEMQSTEKQLLEYGEKNTEIRQKLEQVRNEVSLQQDQASSLEVAIKNLREAAKGYRRGNERQKSALDEKKRSKVEMEQEQTTLIKETLSINREIDEVERQIVTLKRSSSKNSQEIESAEAKNLKLRNSVISKKRELDKEARRHGAVDNDKFDKSAFDEKERQVKSILNKPTTNTTTVQTNAGRPAKLQNQWDSAVESRYPKPAPFLNDSAHFGSSLQPSTLQANPKPLEAIATDLTMDNGSTAHESNPTPSMASQTGSKVSPISVPSKLGTNYIDSNNAIFFPGDSTKSSGFMMDPVSPDMMEIPRKKKPNRPNPLHIPDDIMSVKRLSSLRVLHKKEGDIRTR